MATLRSHASGPMLRDMGSVGRFARDGFYGNPGRMESCPTKKRSGTSLDGGTVLIGSDSYALRVYGSIDQRYKLDGNSYTVSVEKSVNDGVDWLPLVTNATHSVLGVFPEGHKRAGQDRPVCLRMDWDKFDGNGEPLLPGLPKDSLVRVTFSVPNEMVIGIQVEAF